MVTDDKTQPPAPEAPQSPAAARAGAKKAAAAKSAPKAPKPPADEPRNVPTPAAEPVPAKPQKTFMQRFVEDLEAEYGLGGSGDNPS